MAVIRASVILAVVAVALTDATFFKKPVPAGKFDQFKVTLPDPTRPLELGYWFNSVPLTKDQAVSEKWTPLSSDSDCTNGGKYNGFRYIPPTAPSIAAIYDSNGVLVGFQALYDSDKLEHGSSHMDCKTKGKDNTYNFAGEPMIQLEEINGVTKKVLTAYFVEPTTICSSTSDPSKVSTEGYGGELYLQNGPTPSSLIKAPLNRKEAAAQGWENNACLPLNGYHNFWQTSKWDDDQCKTVKPVWFFYDENEKLIGFGFTVAGCDDSPRFQHPPGAIVKQVSGSKCAETVANTVKFSNINCYFVDPVKTVGTCKIVSNFVQKVTNKVVGLFG